MNPAIDPEPKLSSGLDGVVARFGDLGTLAPVASELIAIVDKEDASIADIASVIGRDPGLTKRILSTANSGMYAQSGGVATIERAITVLGLRTVKLLCLGFTLVTGVDDQSPGSPGPLWRASLVTSVLAREITSISAPRMANEAFIAGLLGELGKLALIEEPLYMAADLAGDPWVDASVEERILGFGSDEVTSRIIEGWGLPPLLAQAIQSRTQPGASSEPVDVLARALHVARHAAKLVSTQDRNEQAMALEALHLSAHKYLDLTPEQANDVVHNSEPALSEVTTMFEMGQLISKPVNEIMNSAMAKLTQLSLELAANLAQQSYQAEQLSVDNQRLTQQATTDPLTGLANRRGYDAFLETIFNRQPAKGCSPVVGLLILDLDHFKSINDTHGHPVGDEVLVNVGQRLSTATRDSDFVARVGGEEFALLLPSTNPTDLAHVAQRLCNVIGAEPVLTTAGPLCVTVSVGCTYATLDNTPGLSSNLYQTADRALYHSKSNGRNQATIAAV